VTSDITDPRYSQHFQPTREGFQGKRSASCSEFFLSLKSIASPGIVHYRRRLHQRFPKLCPSPRGGRVVCKKGIFILNEIWVLDKIHILVCPCLVETFYSSLSNRHWLRMYQHILSPAVVRKLVNHWVNFVSNLFILIYSGGGREVHGTF
jgi:hypothetical protein